MKKAIFFFDANNWYHNVKKYHNPSEIDIQKLVNHLCKIKDYELVEIRWYASVPSISDGSDMYYRHISYLKSLEKKGIIVITRKLQKLSNKEILKKKQQIISNLDLCESCKKLQKGKIYNPIDKIKEVDGRKIWIFHALDDNTVPYKPSLIFAKKTKSKLTLIKRGSHGLCKLVFKKRKYLKKITGWFR